MRVLIRAHPQASSSGSAMLECTLPEHLNAPSSDRHASLEGLRERSLQRVLRLRGGEVLPQPGGLDLVFATGEVVVRIPILGRQEVGWSTSTTRSTPHDAPCGLAVGVKIREALLTTMSSMARASENQGSRAVHAMRSLPTYSMRIAGRLASPMAVPPRRLSSSMGPTQ